MTEKIIVKREPKKDGNNLVIFFIDGYKRENNWRIPYYASVAFDKSFGYAHGECQKDWFDICTPVDYTDPEIVAFVCRYVKYIRTLPDMADYSIKLYKRMTK